jgi:DNA adenine methylase
MTESNLKVKAASTKEVDSKVIAKPFLKWAGGKGQLLEKFRELYPAELKKKRFRIFMNRF